MTKRGDDRPTSNGIKSRRVFISYARGDKRKNTDQITLLAQLLRFHNIDVRIDEDYQNERRDWFLWMIDEVDQADYIIVVASPRYRDAANGRADSTSNRGVQSEASLLRDRIHKDRRTWTRRLLPVVLPGSAISDIPDFLQPYCGTRYVIESLSPPGLDELLSTINGTVETFSSASKQDPSSHERNEIEEPDDGEPNRKASTTMNVQARDSSQVNVAGRDINIQS